MNKVKHQKMTRKSPADSNCCRKCIKGLFERFGFIPVIISAILLGIILISLIIIVIVVSVKNIKTTDKTQGYQGEEYPENMGNDFSLSGLRQHNIYRRKHGVDDLVLDENLNKIAQEYAVKLAKTGNFDHGENAKYYGENLYYQCNAKQNIDLNNSTVSATRSWYDEIQYYDFNNPENIYGGHQVLHFTQIIWKNTKKVGFGLGTKVSKETYNGYEYEKLCYYVVANYEPKGNMIGNFKEMCPRNKN